MVVGAFGLDKERDVYFSNSRDCLSDSDKEKGTGSFSKTTKELKFVKVPRNCIALKSIKVSTVKPEPIAVKCKFIQLLDNTRFGDKFNVLEKRLCPSGDQEDALTIVSMHSEDSDRYKALDLADFEHFKAYRFFETLFSNLKGGNMFASLCFRDKNEKSVECNYEMEFYRKVNCDGVFFDKDDAECVSCEFNTRSQFSNDKS